MTHKAELSWQADIVKAINKDGGYARKVGSQFQKGFPDLVVVWGGQTYFFEVKVIQFSKSAIITSQYLHRKIPVTELQRIELSKIHGAGALAFILVIMQATDTQPKNAVMGLLHHLSSEITFANALARNFDRWEAMQVGPVVDMLVSTIS